MSIWLCLSAACDMVPAQLPKWRKESFGQRLPFIAVKLHPRRKMPKDIQSNRYLFLRIQDDVEVFSFNASASEDSKPHWELFFAENAGKFSSNGFAFSIWRTERSVELVEDSGNESSELIMRSYQATVVSELRYEYALNLIQKLGVSLTRVGLDFSEGIRPR